MTKEELFLKYIDDQLTKEEKSEVEALLLNDEASQQLFEKIKETRAEVLHSLEFLNPDETVIIPPFDLSTVQSAKPITFQFKIWHYAAMIALLLGIYFIMKQSWVKTEQPIVEVIPEEIKESKTIYKELDCYISPNRCWNQRQLVWTIIEINH